MKIIFRIFILTFLCSCNDSVQKNKPEESLTPSGKLIQTNEETSLKIYDFDTLLTNGYHLRFDVYEKSNEKSLAQSLTLMKGETTIQKLNETSYPSLSKNLGYIGADFKNHFLFVQSYGSGNPNLFQLIEKRTGNEIVEGTFVDVDEKQEVFLYIKDEHSDHVKTFLYDLRNGNERRLKEFENKECSGAITSIRNCIEIVTADENEVVVEWKNQNEKRRETYNR
ncbi:hypothetical protein LX97_02719 [Nonlabens dokdonensis]|jgi:hypothetical protein|uniref:Uncharacterized protein n=2 Tax=Nonlabens dokdonensis TaxID=328515 RepID=L7WDR4_NONDD|nr:hypothetical protein [Nonlabens dokdonensis]AGC78387.1 hypothetical protein DDD_3260 [Nonlabens dokdonensis DSW-6]PZX38138.1 hypothetical protein LX97_02719 [Nonlabens dokdonensis]